MQQLEPKEAPSPKVVMLGDSRVGKTSIISRQILGHEPETQAPTIGCHCTQIHVYVEGKEVALQVWDTAGQEMYRSLVPVYLRNVRAALLVYDVTDRESFQSLGHWHDLLIDAAGATVGLYIVANKTDLAEQALVEDIQAEEFAEVHNAKFFRVSAVTGAGLDALFRAVAFRMAHDNVEEQSLVAPEPKKGTGEECGC
jgi:small GTP-binding protein